MFQKLIHVTRVVRSLVRETIKSRTRSPEWPEARNAWIKEHPTCAACGSSKRVQVHHCMPFHADPQLELDPTNFISLCMDEKDCHLLIGHSGKFRLYDPFVKDFAAQALEQPHKFPDIVAQAKAASQPNKPSAT
jgi:hypothetical protein